jgi:hypothetical protein
LIKTLVHPIMTLTWSWIVFVAFADINGGKCSRSGSITGTSTGNNNVKQLNDKTLKY